MNNKNLALAALTIALLAACAATQNRPPAPQPRAVGNYQPRAPLPQQYGEWWLEPITCTVRATAEDFTLQTDGTPEDGTIAVKMLSMWPLVAPPSASITGLPVAVKVEGGNRHYTVRIPYTPANVAQMLKEGSFLVLQYQTLQGSQVLQSSFATHGLISAMAGLGLYCRP